MESQCTDVDMMEHRHQCCLGEGVGFPHVHVQAGDPRPSPARHLHVFHSGMVGRDLQLMHMYIHCLTQHLVGPPQLPLRERVQVGPPRLYYLFGGTGDDINLPV